MKGQKRLKLAISAQNIEDFTINKGRFSRKRLTISLDIMSSARDFLRLLLSLQSRGNDASTKLLIFLQYNDEYCGNDKHNAQHDGRSKLFTHKHNAKKDGGHRL